MGFKENLKTELSYSGMLVKELAALSGIKKHTIDNYLNTHNAMPSAEAAVAIARTLGVSVEYLVTGRDDRRDKTIASFSRTIRAVIQEMELLDDNDHQIILALAKALKTHPRNVPEHKEPA
ncbi:MAG: helix-turn-helix transcriptional regulator [Spirochaetaceae bacterium]|jgi:transcriptional regulator with XRE-family HTH domain|nr:helix-turn-helix transcriptional regulator [Spirochaetaceae bacterium]